MFTRKAYKFNLTSMLQLLYRCFTAALANHLQQGLFHVVTENIMWLHDSTQHKSLFRYYLVLTP